jgi:putative transposase
MAIPSRTAQPGTFFVTSRTHNSWRIFRIERNAELFLETLQHYRREGHYKLHAFVVMPDHIHLLLTPLDRSIERVMGLIKGGFSHRLSSRFPVWQRSFTDRRVRDKDEFLVKREYIHQNPIRGRLVASAELYRFSSAYRGAKEASVPSG